MDLRAILRANRDPATANDELSDLARLEQLPASDALKQAIIAAMDLKPERHHFYEQDYAQPVRLMNMTGG